MAEGRPDLKTQKYDRQLRMWAASGQTALESARILVISACATSTQALKNLVLPGLGHFTLLDDALVTKTDVGNNFFLNGDTSIGLSRAKEACELLKEMNPDVSGEADTSSLKERLEGPEDWWASFNLVVVVGLTAEDELKISDLTWKLNRNTMFVQVCGFLASLRIQVREHTVSNTHADPIPDLRINNPFPELLEHVKKYDLDTMTPFDRGNVPYPILLLKQLQSWKKTHNDLPPKGIKETKEFKALIDKQIITGNEENLMEALSQAHQSYKPSSLPTGLAKVLEDKACINVNDKSSSFWIIANAIKTFVESSPQKLAPLSGTIPDMKASTLEFIELQTVYKSRAKEDLAVMQKHIADLKVKLKSEVVVSDEEILSFIQNVETVQVQRGRSLRMERLDDVQTEMIRKKLDEIDMMTGEKSKEATHMSYYLAIQAAAALSKRKTENEEDKSLLKTEMKAHIKKLTRFDDISDFSLAMEEVKQTWGEEMPTVAALMGGIVSQETIKLLTAQYVPVNNVCVWDGIKSSIGVFVL